MVASYNRVVDPVDFPVSRAEGKAALRVDFDDDDELIDALIQAATGALEGPYGHMGTVCCEQTWDIFFDAFPAAGCALEFALGPVISATLFYKDSTGTEQEVGADSVMVDTASKPPRLLMKNGASWPTIQSNSIGGIRLRVEAGFISSEDSPADSPPVPAVPEPIKSAIKLILGDLYENRSTVVVGQTVAQIPDVVKWLVKPYRLHRDMA